MKQLLLSLGIILLFASFQSRGNADGMGNENTNPTTNQWYGKKIIWMGTSIPYGQSKADGGRVSLPYPDQIASALHCTIENNALPGLALEAVYNSSTQTWSPKGKDGSAALTIAEYAAAGVSAPGNKSYENNMLGKDADLYVFDCEPNNSNASTDILNIFDVNTWTYTDGSTLASHRDNYIGCLIYLLDKLWTEKPTAKVVLVGEYGNCKDFAQSYGMSTATKALAAKLHIPYISLYDKLYYNKYNVDEYINADKVHPKQADHNRIAKILINELLLID